MILFLTGRQPSNSTLFLRNTALLVQEFFPVLGFFAYFPYHYISRREERRCDGRWGAQRPILRGNEPKKTGVRSTWPKHTSMLYLYIVHKNGRTLVKISTVYKIICAVCGFCRREVLVFIDENPGTDQAIFLFKTALFLSLFTGYVSFLGQRTGITHLLYASRRDTIATLI